MDKNGFCIQKEDKKIGRITPFEPLVENWFLDRIGQPTDIQNKAWPLIARGEHVLVTAPTGGGKTMASFLWALNQLLFQKWTSGQTRVLYVSPLKALNNDIQRNLLTPLSQLRRLYQEENGQAPVIKVQTRSGDTEQSERRRMLSSPPEILITTPESLNIMLASQGGRGILTALKAVILDEIHAVYSNKRGVHLITAVERLTAISGEFQRIALSATIRPEEEAAGFVGGYMRVDKNRIPRPVEIVRSELKKDYDIRVFFPREAATAENADSIWPPLVKEFKKNNGPKSFHAFFRQQPQAGRKNFSSDKPGGSPTPGLCSSRLPVQGNSPGG